MTALHVIAIGVACGFGPVVAVRCIARFIRRKLERERQDQLVRLHAIRDSLAGLGSAPGKQFEISPRAERNGHDD